MMETEKKKILNAMAKNIDSAGYETIAKEVRAGRNVRKQVTYFLRVYKKTQYGKFYQIKPDGTIDRGGKIKPESRKLYDKIEKMMKRALALYESK